MLIPPGPLASSDDLGRSTGLWMGLLREGRFRHEGGPRRRSLFVKVRIALWALFFFLMTSPFTFFLMGADPLAQSARNIVTNRREEGSQLLLYGLRYAVLAAGLFLIFQKYRLARRMLPGLLSLAPLFLWAAASAAWSDSPTSTINGLLALLPLFLVPFAASVRLSIDDCAFAFLLSGVLMALASIAFVLLLPYYGVHQHSDAAQAVHAGAWRGIYLHKNHLGQAAAVYAVGILAAGPRVIPGMVMKWLMFALLFGVVLGSQSASAIALIPIALMFAWMVICLNPLAKAFAFLYSAALGIIALLSLQLILTMLGRDLTLSGRTEVWQIAATFIMAHPVHGYGYMSTSYGGFSYAVSHAVNVLDPHNGFIDILLGLGFVGFAAFLVPVGQALASARTLFRQKRRGAGAFVLGALMSAWLLACMTESNSRPLGAAAAMGFMAMTLLLCYRFPRPRRLRRAPRMPLTPQHELRPLKTTARED